jgi:hypothetical protein
MKQTLQDQYLLIKEGKGHKGVFLADAKRQFPNIVRNAATFEEASSCLITKNIIAENVIGLTAVNSPFEPKKKESYELAFENFLAEAKKKGEDEKVKAEEKKVSKPVEEDLSHNFDYKDDKNPDNLIFDQIMMGYYTEMKDPKNVDKTMQELKDMVLKNLAKDPIFYTKEGQFGVKGLGYSVDHPGLGEPKEPKGKYKASGYGDLNEGVMYGDSDGDFDEQENNKERAYWYYDAYQGEKDPKKKDEYLKIARKYGSYLGWGEEELPVNEEESKLRKVIREMIDAELSVLPKTSLKESVEKELAAINKEAEHEIIASKLEKVQALIDKKQTQISRLDEDEDLKDLTDAKKVKEISKDIKSLEKAKAKLEKMMHKGKAKSPRKEVIDETDEIIDEAEGDLDPAELDKAEKSIKSIQSLADKIAKTELFEDDEETAYEIKEKAEQYYNEYGTLEDALKIYQMKMKKNLQSTTFNRHIRTIIMNKELLIETRQFTPKPVRLIEGMGNGGNVFVEGILATVEVKNGNGRYYKKELWDREIENFQNKIKQKSTETVGELDHPDSQVINLKNASHAVRDLWWVGDEIHGKVEIFCDMGDKGTTSGRIAGALVKNGLNYWYFLSWNGFIETNG